MATNTTRTRVISQSKAVYVTPTDWELFLTGDDETTDRDMVYGHQLHRVDTFSFDIDLSASRQDVREFGQLARTSTTRLSEIDPTLSFGYYLGNGENELALGFNNSSGAATQMAADMLAEVASQKERNVFVVTAKEGVDAFSTEAIWDGNGQSGYHDTVGFGNCFVSSYSVNLSVGEIPRVDVEMQASNVVFWTGQQSGLFNPSIDLEAQRTHSGLVELPPPDTGALGHHVLRPNDVSITFVDDQISTGTAAGGRVGGVNFAEMPIQSCSIDLPLSREVIDKLGAERAYAKPLDFPIDVTMSINSLVNEFTTGAIEYAINGSAGDKKTNIVVEVKDGVNIRNKFVLSGAVLDSQSFSQGLDDNETVDLTFSAQIGGKGTTDQGLFFTAATGHAGGINGISEVNLTGDNGDNIVSGAAISDQPISVIGWTDVELYDGSAGSDGEPDDDRGNP